MNEKITETGNQYISQIVTAIVSLHFTDDIPLEECAEIYTKEISERVWTISEDEELLSRVKGLAMLFGAIRR